MSDTLQKILELAMLAYSDPHKTAAEYRAALREVCTLVSLPEASRLPPVYSVQDVEEDANG